MDIIDELVKLDDAALAEKAGLSAKLDELKTQLTEAAKLSGSSRKAIAESVKSMLTPDLDPDRVRWRIEDAKRQAAKTKSALEVISSDDPADLVED